MDIHASPAAFPELDEFLATFQVRFRRPEGEAALERSLTGLLTELPNKHCDTMAEAVPGTSEPRWGRTLRGGYDASRILFQTRAGGPVRPGRARMLATGGCRRLLADAGQSRGEQRP